MGAFFTIARLLINWSSKILELRFVMSEKFFFSLNAPAGNVLTVSENKPNKTIKNKTTDKPSVCVFLI